MPQTVVAAADPRCSEADLIAAAFSKDPASADAARAALLARYRPLIFTTMIRVGVPAARRDDALQAGYAGCLRALARFNPGRGTFGSYARSYILGEVLAAAFPDPRATPPGEPAVRRHRTNEELGDDDDALTSVDNRPPTAVVRALRDFLESLSPVRREVLRLVVVEERSQTEVAATRGTSVPAVNKALHRTLADAREHLAACGTALAA